MKTQDGEYLHLEENTPNNTEKITNVVVDGLTTEFPMAIRFAVAVGINRKQALLSFTVDNRIIDSNCREEGILAEQ